MPRLKVFCTTSGFYDHVVAAPSRPAALKAWGARTDLFSMGVAKQVSDPKIEKKALERPGEVIRLKRSVGGEEAPASKRKPRRAAKPPSKARLRAAEDRLAKLVKDQSMERASIERQLKQMQDKLDKLESRHAKLRAEAESKAQEAREAYERALADWDA